MKRTFINKLTGIMAVMLLCATAMANNVYVTNVVYTSATSKVAFQISWDNSWYAPTAPNNWDAVWIFIKYQNCGVPYSNWAHANLSVTSSNHTITPASGSTADLQVDAVADGKGVFIRRGSAGFGSTDVWDCTLLLTTPGAGTYNWRVFAIEMVYIPTANFEVGDGSGTTTDPFNSISITNAEQTGGVTAAVLGGGGATVDLAATYPMGVDSFYCMKHEITQEQYIGFLNLLTFNQQITRTSIPPDTIYGNWALTGTNRDGIKISYTGVDDYVPAQYSADLDGDNSYWESNDGINVPANFISWADLAAYLDWSGLRPMSDLEYEKICRGTVARVADEYPWGSTELIQATSASLTNAGNILELYSGALDSGICVYNGVAGNGPIRSGFAATSSTNRQTASAAYYGPLEMAGNVWERVVAVNTTGAAFTGLLGDGALDANGNADAANWPVTTAVGSGSRGGGWEVTAANSKFLRLSDRTYATTANASRLSTHGGRGVRQLP